MKKINPTNRKLKRFILIIIAIFLLSVTVKAITKEEENIGGVDKELCIECGNCWYIDPLYIKEDYDGKAKVFNPILDEQKFKEAQNACPVGAIWSNF
ncbi:MAG: ferredoxin [Rikenellaceae bacterium]